jgi:protein LTV1
MPKKRFINKKAAETFHVVHRSQRDALIDDPSASKFVLVSAKDGAVRGDSCPKPNRFNNGEGMQMGKALSTIDDLGFDYDGYDYKKHMRPMGKIFTVLA